MTPSLHQNLNLRALAALGTAGPGTEIILGANEEYSSYCYLLKVLCITIVPCVFLFKPRIQERWGKNSACGM